MNSLIWQSVMWRPGKGWFLIGMKNPPPTRPAAIASQRAPSGAAPFLIQIDALLRIASPGMLPDAEPLPHLICSRLIYIGGVNDEADQHDGA